jgi:hypothetical protein
VQQTKETTPVAERSRRRPPRQRSDEPIRIPQAQRRAGRTRTVKLQDVLKAYRQVIIDAVDERMAGVAELAAAAARGAVEDVLRAEVIPDATTASADDVRIVGHRLDRIEEAVRRLEGIAEAVDRLSTDHRALAEDLGRRTGEGVVAVARVLREDLRALRADLAGMRTPEPTEA